MNVKPGRRRWVAGALRAGRAAAFLTLATGINGTIAALEPRYEPIYVYLVAVVVVAWLGGALLGVTTAVVAVVLYDTMFAPVEGLTPSWSTLVPLVVAVGAAVVTQLVRAPLRRPQFAAVPPPALLETTAPKLVSVMPAAVDTRELDDLREQLAEARRQRDEARAAAERESQVRIESAATARARLAGLQHELDTARNDALEQARRAAALHGQIDDLSQRDAERSRQTSALEQAAATIANREQGLERELQTARSREHDLDRRLNETLQELEVAWRRVDEEKGRSDAEAARLVQLERQANEALQKAVADLANRYEQPLSEAKQRLADAFTRIPLLETERDAANARLEQERAERQRLATEFDARMQTIVTNLTNDYEETLGQATVERESARAEARALRKTVDALQQKLADFDRARISMAADYVIRLEAAEANAAALQSEAERARGDAEESRALAELERAQRERMEADVDRKIASMAAGLTSDYEDSLGQAMVEKEAARAEIRGLAVKNDALKKQLAALTTQLDETSSRAELERSQRERVEADVDRKIASIAAGLTSDYEDSLGQAMVEKEGARAEIRSLSAKLEALQQELAESRSAAETVAAYAERLTNSEVRLASLQMQLQQAESDLEASRSQLDAARADNDRMAASFDGKIASIVANITNDHEQAIGEAMIEREAARAELRAAVKKLEAEKKRAEDEKARVDAEWGEKLQTIVSHLASDHETDIGEAMLQKEEARAEARDLSNRVRSLQQRLDVEREQHRQTMAMLDAERTARSDPAAPPPSSRRVILVVHSDAGLRAMTKHALEQAGYSVVTAADGLEGLRLASSQRPDAVLAEAIMPKMNGRELVQLLKARSETVGVKVVLINSGQGSSSEKGSDFRADDFLDSPADIGALKASLANLLGK